MTTTVSPKYQIVIPKAVRRELNIKPGQKMKVEAGLNGSIIVKQVNGVADIGATLDALWAKTGHLKVGKKLTREEMNER